MKDLNNELNKQGAPYENMYRTIGADFKLLPEVCFWFLRSLRAMTPLIG